MTQPSPNRSLGPGDQPRILLVGHCRPDAFLLKTVVERSIPGALVTMVNTQSDLTSTSADLWLVNRALDGSFDAADGINLIRDAAANPAGRPVLMLISNYPEAQEEAEQAGAIPGFGKTHAYAAESANRLRRAVGLPTQD